MAVQFTGPGTECCNMWRQKKFGLDRDTCTSSISIEVPIFSPNQTRRFIVDSIIDLSSVKHCSAINGSSNILVSARSFSGKEVKIVQNAIYRKFLIEIKPQPLSISSAISQVKTYQNFLRYNRWDRGISSERLSNADLVILTIDRNDSYDQMLESQSINIFHIPPKEIKR